VNILYSLRLLYSLRQKFNTHETETFPSDAATVYVSQRKVFKEILPNALSPLGSELGLRFIFMVLYLSTLSFLGLGIQPPATDWGAIVKENSDGLVYGIPAALAPAIAIATLAVSVNLVADWALTLTTSLKGGRE